METDIISCPKCGLNLNEDVNLKWEGPAMRDANEMLRGLNQKLLDELHSYVSMIKELQNKIYVLENKGGT